MVQIRRIVTWPELFSTLLLQSSYVVAGASLWRCSYGWVTNMGQQKGPDMADTARLIDDIRGVRYGEVIAVFARGGHFEAEVFGTQFLNDCPQDLWDTLDPSAIATELGALVVKLNGPRHWVIDGIGQKVNTLEPVLREFNGLLMRRLALIDLGERTRRPPPTLTTTCTAAPSSSLTLGSRSMSW